MADATDRNHDREMTSKKHGTALTYKYVFGALGSNRLWRRNFVDKLGASSNSSGELFGDGGEHGQWHTLPYTMPTNPVHAALLHTGPARVLNSTPDATRRTDLPYKEGV